MSRDDAQLQEWIQSAETWLEEQRAELWKLRDRARELLVIDQDSSAGELRGIKADLAALQEDMDSVLQQIEGAEAVPARIWIKSGIFQAELEELMADLNAAL